MRSRHYRIKYFTVRGPTPATRALLSEEIELDADNDEEAILLAEEWIRENSSWLQEWNPTIEVLKTETTLLKEFTLRGPLRSDPMKDSKAEA